MPHTSQYRRFIPTSVGNAGTRTSPDGMTSVHPHVCGERSKMLSQSKHVIGSSPRLWGTLLIRPRTVASSRFIPTSVGNAFRAASFASFATVHPHVCGERVGLASLIRPISVHPHVCGERRTFHSRTTPLIGSSPRLWGTPTRFAPVSHWTRFIPTSVGNASSAFIRSISCSVHPHVCGERKCRDAGITGVDGSSPRLWGTLLIFSWAGQKNRFIPTSVGNAYCCL